MPDLHKTEPLRCRNSKSIGQRSKVKVMLQNEFIYEHTYDLSQSKFLFHIIFKPLFCKKL